MKQLLYSDYIACHFVGSWAFFLKICALFLKQNFITVEE
jgi:hypothetical protein